MTDIQIPYVAPDGTRSIEAAAQLLGRILLPVGDGAVTLPQALADRPTQADVAAALAAALANIQPTDVDLAPIFDALADKATREYVATALASALVGTARAGENANITALTGLTTALSVGQGGTGAKTAPDARAALGLGPGDSPAFAGDTLAGPAGSIPTRRWKRDGKLFWAEELLPEGKKGLSAFSASGQYLGYAYQAAQTSGTKGRGNPVISLAASNFDQPRAATYQGANVLGNIVNHDTANQPVFVTVTDAITTTAGSGIFRIAIPAHGLNDPRSQWVRLAVPGGSVTVGGLQIPSGPYKIVGYPTVDAIDVQHATATATTAATGGGTVDITIAVTVEGESYRFIIRNGNNGFPVGTVRHTAFAYDFEEPNCGSEAEWVVVQGHPGSTYPGPNTNMGEHNPVNRSIDMGFARSLDVTGRQMMGLLWAPETADIIGDGKGAYGRHCWAPHTVHKSPNPNPENGFYAGWYQGYHIGPGALVGQGRDAQTGHGGVGFVVHGDYTEANSLATTAGSASVAVVLRFDAQMDVGDEFVFHSAVSVGGLTLLGPYQVATKADRRTFTFNAPGNASSTVAPANNAGFGARLSFKKERPRAILHAYGGFVRGLDLTRGYYESGQAIALPTGAAIALDTAGGVTLSSEGSRLQVKGAVSLRDSNAPVVSAGITTQANNVLVQYGINDVSFGAGTDATKPSGFLRLDTRGGPVFQFYAAPSGGNSAPIATIDAFGNAAFNGQTSTPRVALTSFTVATLPAGSNGQIAYASNGRKVSEGAGAGTGVIVAFSNGNWRRLSDDSAVAA